MPDGLMLELGCTPDTALGGSFRVGFRQNLSEFRRALEVERALKFSGLRTRVIVLTAAKEVVKAVAYAAYRLYHGDDRSAPNPSPEQWDRYMAGFWPDLLDMFAAIPAAGEPADNAVLARTLYAVRERTLRWLEELGVRYEVQVYGAESLRSCWWSVAEPI